MSNLEFVVLFSAGVLVGCGTAVLVRYLYRCHRFLKGVELIMGNYATPEQKVANIDRLLWKVFR